MQTQESASVDAHTPATTTRISSRAEAAFELWWASKAARDLRAHFYVAQLEKAHDMAKLAFLEGSLWALEVTK